MQKPKAEKNAVQISMLIACVLSALVYASFQLEYSTRLLTRLIELFIGA